MISTEKYVNMSLEVNLLGVRIMKEHAVFIEGALPHVQSKRHHAVFLHRPFAAQGKLFSV